MPTHLIINISHYHHHCYHLLSSSVCQTVSYTLISGIASFCWSYSSHICNLVSRIQHMSIYVRFTCIHLVYQVLFELLCSHRLTDPKIEFQSYATSSGQSIFNRFKFFSVLKTWKIQTVVNLIYQNYIIYFSLDLLINRKVHSTYNYKIYTSV